MIWSLDMMAVSIFTDFKGTPWHPTGGIYYVSEDGQHIQPVIQGLAMPNGIA